MSMRKIHDNFAFPSFMNLDEFLARDAGGEGTGAGSDVHDSSIGGGSSTADETEDETASDKELKKQPAGNYILHSVLVHAGDYGGGHYYAYIRPGHHHNYAKNASEAVQRLNDAKACLQMQLKQRLLTRKYNATSGSSSGTIAGKNCHNKRSMEGNASVEAMVEAPESVGESDSESEIAEEKRIYRELNNELYEEIKDAGRGGKWFKFDDENVYEVQEEEAIDFNFGRGHLNAGFSSAYMLLYIRADAIDEMMAPINSNDIPVTLVRRLSQEHYVSHVEHHISAVVDQATKGCLINLFTEANLAEFDISALKLANRYGSNDNDFHCLHQYKSISLPQSTTLRRMFYSLCVHHLQVSPVQVRLWLEVKDSGRYTYAHGDKPLVRRLGCPLTLENITSGQQLDKWLQSMHDTRSSLSTALVDTIDGNKTENQEILPLLFDAKMGTRDCTIHLYAEILPSRGPLVREDDLTKRAAFEAIFTECRNQESLLKAKVVNLFSKHWQHVSDDVREGLKRRFLRGLDAAKCEMFCDHESTWAALFAELDAESRDCGLLPQEQEDKENTLADGGTSASDHKPDVQALIDEIRDIEEIFIQALTDNYPRLRYGHRYTAVKLFDVTKSFDARELHIRKFFSSNSDYPSFETTSAERWWCDEDIASDETVNECGLTNGKIAQYKQKHHDLEQRLDPKCRYLKFLDMLHVPCPDYKMRDFLDNQSEDISSSIPKFTTDKSLLSFTEKLALSARDAYMRDLKVELSNAIQRCGVDTSSSPWWTLNNGVEDGAEGGWKLWIAQGISQRSPLITVDDAVLYHARVLAGKFVESLRRRNSNQNREDENSSNKNYKIEPIDVTEHPFLPLNHHGGVIVVEPVIP